ncbi:MAG: MAPEG family protein [Sphingomonadales bacterium]
MQTVLLAPLMALVLWTFVMWAWMYATRIPAIRRGGVPLSPSATKEEFNSRIPPHVRWKADNYNHLLEQPVLFYAVVLTLALLGADGPANVALAWGYVALRVAHSIVQATANIIMVRFSVFILASFVLLALAIRAAMLVFQP